MAGAQLSVVTNVADISRFARSRADVRIGLLGGSTLGAFAGAWVGAYAATASGEVNPFLAASELTANEAVLVALLVALLVQTVSVNVINVYTGGLSLVNTLPRLGRVRTTVLVGTVSVALAAFPDFVDSAQVWFVRLGNVAGPITGVVLVDLLVLQRGRIDVAELFRPDGRYRYLGGLNAAAAGAVAVGVAAAFAVPESWVKVAWGVGLAAAAYPLLAAAQRAALRPRPSLARGADAP